MNRTVCVCICTRNRPAELAAALTSVAASRYPVARVVVADDGDTSETAAVCNVAPVDVDYVQGPRLGLGPNRNRAIAESHEDLLLFLDDDCLLSPDFLVSAVTCMEEAEADVGTGRIIVTGQELNRGSLVPPRAQDFLGFQQVVYCERVAMTSIVINATLFPRALFDSISFDPAVRYGYDEVDLVVRAVDDGFVVIYCPEAINEHRPSNCSRDNQSVFMNAARLHVTYKRYAFVERRPWRAAAFAVIAPLHLVGAAIRRQGLRGLSPALSSLTMAVRSLRRHRAAKIRH